MSRVECPSPSRPALASRLLPVPLVAILALLAAGCGGAKSDTPGAGVQASAGCRSGSLPASEGERHELDGRTYLVDAPAALADRPLPLVLAFHGFRSNPEDLRAGTGLPALARRESIVAVYPEGHDGVALLDTVGRGWDLRPDQTRDRDFVRALLDQVEAERCIDRHRVFATGMSNGGFFSSLLGCQLADRIAAVAAVAGASELGGCRPARPVPILLLHGSNDHIVRSDLVQTGIDWWVERNGCGTSSTRDGCTSWTGCSADVVACEGSQAHSWPPGATERIWRFFAAHPRP